MLQKLDLAPSEKKHSEKDFDSKWYLKKNDKRDARA